MKKTVPAVPVAGKAVIVTCRSAEGLTVVVEVALLLVRSGSEVDSAVSEAVFESLPPSAKYGSMGWVMLWLSLYRAVRPLELQVTAPAACVQPGAETKLVPAGSL